MAGSPMIDKVSVGRVDREHPRLVWWPRVGLLVTLIGVVCVLILQTSRSVAQDNGYSLRFYGHGVDDIDRVRIPIDPPVPADVGATGFTFEWWMKATSEENGSPSCTPGGDNWIYGNIVFDRDIWGPGDHGDYGISLAGGRIAFGANNGDSGETLCGSVLVADGSWHHVAVTRRRSDGLLRIFVDGQLDGEVDGPDGDVSYRDGRSTWAEDDPFLVIGAEKHDAGPEYPSYSGWIDEVRLSGIVRYTSAFEPPSAAFTGDGNTVALYHLDEGLVGACTGTVLDSSGASGGPSNGTCNFGGADPAGPVYTTDVPFTQDMTPPSISDVAASPLVTETVITWTTDEPATSRVTYGISPTLNLSTTESTEYVISHEVVLANLSPNTAYAYVVRSTDEAGNTAVSEVFSFRTLASQYPNHIYLPLVLRSPGLTTGQSPAPRGGVWPWGCGAVGASSPHDGLKAPPSESISALRAPGQSSDAPATAEFTDTREHLFRYLSIGFASSVVLISVVIVSVRCRPQARRRQGESSKDDNRVPARGPT